MNWNITTLKMCAKHELSRSYWLSFAVILVGGLISGAYVVFNYITPVISISFDQLLSSPSSILNVFAISIVAMLVYMALVFLYSAFLSNPIRVGTASFFINAPRGQREIGNLFSAFKNGRYMPAVKAMFARDIRLLLWSLIAYAPLILTSLIFNYMEPTLTMLSFALVLPWITFAAYIPYYIKYLQWFFVPYIVADNPDIDPKDALELSTQMTNGQKGRIFVLMLSFIGWYLLGYLACCVGVFFVMPYQEATFAHLYFACKGEIPVDTSSPYPPYPQYPAYPPYPPYPPHPPYPPQGNGCYGYNAPVPPPAPAQDAPTDPSSD